MNKNKTKHKPRIRPGFVCRLTQRYAGVDGENLLRAMIEKEFLGEIALVSSFGADSAVLLHMVSTIAPAIPVFFLNTEKHFPETLAYRQKLVRQLGLSDVRDTLPESREVMELDPHGSLHTRDFDACCNLRKVRPLERALTGFEARITGRKRFQTRSRHTLETIDWSGDQVVINPLANWNTDALKTYILQHNLPRHPLVAAGFASIGCRPCTSSITPGEDDRAGRWRGIEKTECGIHSKAKGDRARMLPLGC